jgi:hypothetical protein
VSRNLRWLPEAVDDLLAIPEVAIAGAIDRAVQEFAESGRGFVRRLVREHTADDFVLYVAETRYVVRLRWLAGTVFVERVLLRAG